MTDLAAASAGLDPQQVARISGLFNNSLVAMSLTGLNATPLAVNAALYRLFDAAPETMEGLGVLDVTYPDDRAATAAVMEKLRKGEIDTARMENRIVTIGGSVRWVDKSITLIRDDDGKPAAWLTLLVDITERVEMEAELRDATRAAEAAVAARTELLSRVSHELRTPLTAILGFAELLKMEEPHLIHAEWLETILSAGEHLLHLVEDVLDISRGSALPLAVSQIDIVGLIADAVELVKTEAGKAEINIVAPAADGTLLVSGDRRRLKQILLNLLSNAVKYNRHGGEVTITLESLPERVQIRVADTGPGIAPADLDRIFVPFERVNREVSEVPGVGLGLALSRVLAEAMGGTVAVSSVPGEGSVFALEMPAAH